MITFGAAAQGVPAGGVSSTAAVSEKCRAGLSAKAARDSRCASPPSAQFANQPANQQYHLRQEFAAAVRALLMTPLMNPVHDAFAAVRRHADELREWFARETGWVLHIEREGARLYKRPADLTDATRGLPDYDRRRYVLLSLACAVLDRAGPQITLCDLGERLLELANEPALVDCRFTFTLSTQNERHELVAVCRTLLHLGVLSRVAGDEEGFVRAGADTADALYDVHRPTLSGMLATVRGPSTWAPREAPVAFEERLRALVAEHVADSDEGRRTALRHHLRRRLLDDPVIYTDAMDAEARVYFVNQRGAMAAHLREATGLTAEMRAEGLALVDETGELTDVAMPAEGTDSHVTLLVADHLATHNVPMHEEEIATFLCDAKVRHGRYWRKSVREPGAEGELATIALERLEKLRLIVRDRGIVSVLPALARFELGDPRLRSQAAIT